MMASASLRRRIGVLLHLRIWAKYCVKIWRAFFSLSPTHLPWILAHVGLEEWAACGVGQLVDGLGLAGSRRAVEEACEASLEACLPEASVDLAEVVVLEECGELVVLCLHVGREEELLGWVFHGRQEEVLVAVVGLGDAREGAVVACGCATGLVDGGGRRFVFAEGLEDAGEDEELGLGVADDAAGEALVDQCVEVGHHAVEVHHAASEAVGEVHHPRAVVG